MTATVQDQPTEDRVIEIRTLTMDTASVDRISIDRGNYPTIHAACLAAAAQQARQAGRPLLTHAYDLTQKPEAEYWLLVHPDGRAEPSPAPIHEPRFITDRQHNDAAVLPAVAAPSAPDASARPPAYGPPASSNQPPHLPTLDDLIAQRPAADDAPADHGWQARIRRLTGGLIAPKPGPAEQQRRAHMTTVRGDLAGPKTVVVVNVKGGATKTTATVLISATFGLARGGSVLAWDNNETRGTLGWRALHAGRSLTAVDLLRDLSRFEKSADARLGDLDAYVRHQGAAQFDVLASDEDPQNSEMIDADAFRRLHETLARFYRLIVVDTGNNLRAPNYQASLDIADQLVIVSTIEEDTAGSAGWVVDALRGSGRTELVDHAVTVLAAPAGRIDAALHRRLHQHFAQTRAVYDVPFDPHLVGGRPINISKLKPKTRDAWVPVAAAIADGLR